MRRFTTALVLAAITVALSGVPGCSQQEGATSPSAAAKVDPQSLYVRLGGEPAIRKVVDAFTAKLAADGRINQSFAKADMPKLKTKIVQQLCELTGGPQVYLGKDMKTAHRGMNITEFQWDAFVDDLVKTLKETGVPAPEREELLVKLAPMKSDVVGQ